MKEEYEISKQPRIVKSHDIRIDGDYAEWIAELKHRYRSAQVKASVPIGSWGVTWCKRKPKSVGVQEWWSK